MPSPSAASFYLDYTLSSLAGPYGEKVAGPRTLFAELLGADLEVGPGRARDSPDTAAATELSQGPLGVASAVGVRMTGYQLCAKRKPR